MRKKERVAGLSVLSNTCLIAGKIFVGLVTGSVSIYSEAIHSGMDLVASFIALYSVKVSDNVPDERHNYGHGKFENISGVIEAVLIFIAAFWIIFKAFKKLSGNEPIESIEWGTLVMFISALINFIVSRRLYKVAKETESVALEADALHLKTDVYTSVSVGVGLIIIWATGYYFLDPVIAILVAIMILRESWILLKKAYSPLVDVSLNEEELAEIKIILNEMKVNYHDLRSRKAGNYKFIDFHITLPPQFTLDKVHDYCDQIESRLKSDIHHLSVNIHAEPIEIN